MVLLEGPLVSQPQTWIVAFSRTAATRWASWLALGRYKHVRAFGYVPFLHVWVFVDPHLSGTDIVVAADGEPANRLIGAWLRDADALRMRCRQTRHRRPAVFGWCVPSVKRLIGLSGGALRADTLWRHCLANGGVPFEGSHGSAKV